MSQLNIALAVMGGVAVGIALLSAMIKRNPISEPAIAVIVGLAVGPFGLGWLDLQRWGDVFPILEQAARLTVAIGLMGVAMRLQQHTLRRLLKPVALLLTVVMLGMWLVSSALAGWLLGFSPWAALLLGAVITPTDPVVASSIVTGKFAEQHLPLRLRDTLSAESGANDGLAYLFVMLPILILSQDVDAGWSRWLFDAVLVGVLGAAVFGGFVGWAAARLLRYAQQRDWVASTSLLGYTVAFTLLTLGLAKLLNTDGLLAVFAAGLAFNLSSDRQDEQEDEHIQEAVAKLFTLPMFVLFGIALPLQDWVSLGWPLIALAISILLLRRLPIVMLASLGWQGILNRRDSIYLGWFGPLGIAAIYYAALAHRHLHDPSYWHAVSALIFCSIMAHGVTAAPLSRWYASTPGPKPKGAPD